MNSSSSSSSSKGWPGNGPRRGSRPCGTYPATNPPPALKRRAIFRKSLRDCAWFVLGSILLVGFGAKAETTNALSDAEIQGRALARKIIEQQPTEDSTNWGILKIKDGAGKKSEIRVEMRVKAQLTNWYGIFTTMPTNGAEIEELIVAHPSNNKVNYGYGGNRAARLESFANSDFSAWDLSLSFLYWPGQKILKKEFRRNCSCAVLESTDPHPGTNGYSRVVCWIDEDSGGIVMARAYDTQGRLLKEFYPKDIKKVKGQWQVESMDIWNVQTGSRTRLEFDLKSP